MNEKIAPSVGLVHGIVCRQTPFEAHEQARQLDVDHEHADRLATRIDDRRADAQVIGRPSTK